MYATHLNNKIESNKNFLNNFYTNKTDFDQWFSFIGSFSIQ